MLCCDEAGRNCLLEQGRGKTLRLSSGPGLAETCYDVLEGMGPLGTRLCHRHCSVVQCAGNTAIPNFDMSLKTRTGDRLVDQHVNLGIRQSAGWRTPAAPASRPRHYGAEEDRRAGPKGSRFVEATHGDG